MSYFRISGGRPLAGTIIPMGNKNAALPLLAAALLTDEVVVLRNVPDIGDVRAKLEILRSMGVRVSLVDHVCTIDASGIRSSALDPELCASIRTSILLVAPLLVRFGQALMPRPGGDRIGRRNLDTHLLALNGLGVRIESAVHGYQLTANTLTGTELFLEEMSVTGTEQALLAAVLARGTTRILQAATEPHVQDLCHCLNAMGARISGTGSHELIVEGVSRLRGTDFSVSPDYMEVGSLIALAAATRSKLRIRAAQPENQRITQVAFARLGVSWQVDGDDIVVPDTQHLAMQAAFDGATPKIDDLPWPGFPPDLISIAAVLATQCDGSVLIQQRLFDRRLVFVDRLIDMGARIVQCDPHRVVVLGATPLHGLTLSSPDIRAGMALLIAALAAKGESKIYNVGQIDRGYEALELRLQSLGADIERIDA